LNYIFGYGSLIEQASRTRTTAAAIYVLPAKVKGFARGWWARTGVVGFSTTFAGAIPKELAFMNGVVYAVSDDELDRTDKRESGYTRTDITKSVEILGGSFKPEGKVWVYLNKFNDEQELKNSLPSAEFPIVQSYVDICLAGCLQIQQGFPEAGNFAAEFIQSTQEWSKYWENDRANPRRPFAIPMAQDIDVLLKKYLPTYFSEIRLAPGRW
jgi:Gamma-glutamyl cyclotransferase, AIG2-like